MSPSRITLSAALALLASGCLGEPEQRSCADLPPGSPGCPADEPDRGADEGPPLDMGEADRGADDGAPDMAADGPSAVDMGADDVGADDIGPGDMGPGDMGSGDGGSPDMDPGDMGPPAECEPGTARPCGSDEGACQAGQQFCNAEGVYDECLGAVGPAEETCNGQDDDCNGETDEGCDCVDDTMQPCGNAVGACSAGTQLCTGGAWGPCEGAIDGSEEVCDDIDNDCNGEIDDLPAIVNNQMCSVGIGQCRATGPLTCDGSNDGQPICLADAGPPMVERCNRLDDDCDGTIDEEIDPRRTDLYAGGQDDIERRPELVAYGEFVASAWIEDGRVKFGLSLGDAWEIDPVEVGGFNGDDTIAEYISLAAIPNGGFRLAVSYDGLGSGLTVLRLGADGSVQRQADYDVEVPRTGPIDLALQPDVAFSVAFERQNAAAGTTYVEVETVPADGMIRPVRRTLSEAQRSYRQPSVVLVNGMPVVATVRADPRSTDGDIVLAPMADGLDLRRPVVLSDTGTARNPDLRWLPQRQLYAVAWDETNPDMRELRRVRVALVSAQGEVLDVLTMPSPGTAQRPSLVPIPEGRDGVQRLAVSWDSQGDVGFNILLGWALDTGRGWVASPGWYRGFGNQGSTVGSRSAYAPDGDGLATIFTYDDTRSTAIIVSSLPAACPQQP